jgi:FtsZ-binding cell division protein ZapB
MTKNKVVMLIAASISLAGPAALSAAPELALTRSTLKEWVGLKKLVSEEKNNWAVEKQSLNESIDLLKDEIQKIEESIVEYESEASDADKVREELTMEENELKAASAIVKNTIVDLEAEMLEIIKYLPTTLQEKVAIPTGRIPTTKREIDAARLTDRILNVIAILTEIEKFNSQLTVVNEIRDINGERVRVDTLYVGLGVAYYVDGTRSEAGYMVPAKDEWKRFEDNSLAEDIALAVAMQKREATPGFVSLPITITEVE